MILSDADYRTDAIFAYPRGQRREQTFILSGSARNMHPKDKGSAVSPISTAPIVKVLFSIN